MTIHTFWMFAFCLLKGAVLTESYLPEHKTYVRDALTQNAFVIKTWKCRAFSLIVIVSKGNEIILAAEFHGDSLMEQGNRLLIKYNYRTEEVSVLLNNVNRSDEGLYQISSHILKKAANSFDAISKTWNVRLYVLANGVLNLFCQEPGAIKQGYAGESILFTTVVPESTFTPRLYHKGTIFAIVEGSDCNVNPFSELYGRIICSKDKDSNKTRIEIKNVTENDTGLYKVVTKVRVTHRYFLKITGTYTDSARALSIVNPPERCDEINSDRRRNETLPLTVLSSRAVNRVLQQPGDIKHGLVGENILIAAFDQESLFFAHVYHNYEHVAAVTGSECDVSTHSPFYGRVRCSKDKNWETTKIEIENVTENDNGIYTVETEGSLIQRCFLHITSTKTKRASELIIVTLLERFEGINSDQPSNITLSTTVRSSTVVNLAHSLTYTASTKVLNIATAPESSNVINSEKPSKETLPTTVLSHSAVTLVNSLSVPIYIIPVIIGAVGIINLVGCLLWVHMTKAEQHIPQDERNPSLYLTPIALEPTLTVSTCQERNMGLSNIANNTNINPCTGSIHMISMDGYEVVDISNNDDPEITPELEEIIYESTANCNTRYSDTSGYLIVLGRRETTV